MQDWASVLSSLIQLLAAFIIFAAAGREMKTKKGTKKRRRAGKRK